MNDHMKQFYKGWHALMGEKETTDLAYWERNMLALVLANVLKEVYVPSLTGGTQLVTTRSGWYYDRDNNWEGWLRVISINNGSMTFHVPDAFDLGDLPEIEPNWDGHTTQEKWEVAMAFCGVLPRDHFDKETSDE